MPRKQSKKTKRTSSRFKRPLRKRNRSNLAGTRWIQSVNRSLRMKPNDVYFKIVRRTDASMVIGCQEASATDYCLMSRNSKSFNLHEVHNYSELTALFDYYRIKAVECRFTPFGNVAEQANPTANSQLALMKIMYKIDNDDVNIPDFSTMKESGCKSFMLPPEGFVITLRPKPLKLAYEGAVGNAYTVGTGKDWLDCDDDIPHYGLKWIVYSPHINPGLAGGYPHYQIEYRYVLEFRGLL